VDLKKLSKILGVPVVGTSARSGEGLEELKDEVALLARKSDRVKNFKVKYSETVEESIGILMPYIEKLVGGMINSRWVALRLLEGESVILQSL
jgi:Ferrous iron transport protein B.